MMLFPTPVSPTPIQTMGDVTAFRVQITAADIAAGTNSHRFYVTAGTNYSIYWGDRSVTGPLSGFQRPSHTYSAAGTYLVQVKGNHTRFTHIDDSVAAGHVTDVIKLYSGLTSLRQTFYSCGNPAFRLLPSAKIGPLVTDAGYFIFFCQNSSNILYPGFRFPVNVVNLQYALASNVKMVFTVTPDLFPDWPDGTAIDVSGVCLNDYLITGSAPASKLWGRSGITWTSTGAFSGATKLSNYAAIPAGWK